MTDKPVALTAERIRKLVKDLHHLKGKSENFGNPSMAMKNKNKKKKNGKGKVVEVQIY
jgi:hypothetical protein